MTERLTIKPSAKLEWEAYVAAWKQCSRCELSKIRSSICHVRGVLPAKILLIGEAPGDSENTLGYPFVGPSGKLLDQWLYESGLDCLPLAFTNTVGCIPYEAGEDNKSPPKKAIKACSERLLRIIGIAQPTWVIAVGKVAHENGIPSFGDISEPTRVKFNLSSVMHVKTAKRPHPSAVLQSRGGEQQLLIRRAFNVLDRIAEDMRCTAPSS
jgi:uracil-DNA glycosylase family 4